MRDLAQAALNLHFDPRLAVAAFLTDRAARTDDFSKRCRLQDRCLLLVRILDPSSC